MAVVWPCVGLGLGVPVVSLKLWSRLGLVLVLVTVPSSLVWSGSHLCPGWCRLGLSFVLVWVTSWVFPCVGFRLGHGKVFVASCLAFVLDLVSVFHGQRISEPAVFRATMKKEWGMDKGGTPGGGGGGAGRDKKERGQEPKKPKRRSQI